MNSPVCESKVAVGAVIRVVGLAMSWWSDAEATHSAALGEAASLEALSRQCVRAKHASACAAWGSRS